MRIYRDYCGDIVTAKKDADKTFNAPETIRYIVGYADTILTQGFADNTKRPFFAKALMGDGR